MSTENTVRATASLFPLKMALAVQSHFMILTFNICLSPIQLRLFLSILSLSPLQAFRRWYIENSVVSACCFRVRQLH